jgi:rare lipoprotein A
VIFCTVLVSCSTTSHKASKNSKLLNNFEKPKSEYDSTYNNLEGMSSWYGKELRNRKTANGERFNMYAMTAAHRTLPFGTLVRVKNRKNGKEVIVRINDRGPYSKKRLIDLSYGAARELGIVQSGVARVEIEIIRRGVDI